MVGASLACEHCQDSVSMMRPVMARNEDILPQACSGAKGTLRTVRSEDGQVWEPGTRCSHTPLETLISVRKGG